MARKRRCRQNGPREKAVLIRVDDDEKRMLQDAARRRGQTVSLTVIEAVKLLEGSLYVEEEEHDSPTVQALREIEYQLRRIGRNVNQIAHNVNREMNATIEDEDPEHGEEMVSMTVKLPKSQLEKVTETARRYHISRSEYVRRQLAGAV